MEEASSASNTTARPSDTPNNSPGNDIFWSDIHENYTLLETVDLSDSPKITASGSLNVALENELREAHETISELRKENASLQNHVVQLETSRSSGLDFNSFWFDCMGQIVNNNFIRIIKLKFELIVKSLENRDIVSEVGDAVSKLFDEGLQRLKDELLESLHLTILSELTK